MQDKDNIAILIVSCDAYADLWQPLISSLRRHWQNCPYKIYLSTNYLKPHFNGISVLPVGEDISWSDNLRFALSLIEEQNVLLHIDDLIHCDDVDVEGLRKIFNWFIASGAKYVKCYSTNLQKKPNKQLVRLVEKGGLYRISTVFTLWEKNTLLSLLRPGENAWEFEVLGSERADRLDGIYAATCNHFCFMNGVVKGKWDLRALKKLSVSGVYADLTLRKAMTHYEQFVLFYKECRSNMLNFFPERHRRSVKKFFLRDKFSNYRQENKK